MTERDVTMGSPAGWQPLRGPGLHGLVNGDERLVDELRVAWSTHGFGDVDAMLDVLSRGGIATMPDFVIVSDPIGEPGRVVVRGRGYAVLSGPNGSVEIRHHGRMPWHDRDIPSDVTDIEVRSEYAGGFLTSPPPARTAPVEPPAIEAPVAPVEPPAIEAPVAPVEPVPQEPVQEPVAGAVVEDDHVGTLEPLEPPTSMPPGEPVPEAPVEAPPPMWTAPAEVEEVPAPPPRPETEAAPAPPPREEEPEPVAEVGAPGPVPDQTPQAPPRELPAPAAETRSVGPEPPPTPPAPELPSTEAPEEWVEPPPAAPPPPTPPASREPAPELPSTEAPEEWVEPPPAAPPPPAPAEPAAAEPHHDLWAPRPPARLAGGSPRVTEDADARRPRAEEAGPPVDHRPPEGSATATGPRVLAALCPADHLSPPYARTCRVCGREITPQQPFEAVRPVLGVLRLSTGDVIELDRGAVFGRSPRPAADVDPALQPHLVRVPSPQNDISRRHAEIVLDGWRVLVRDLGSTNGTTVELPGRQPARLRPHDDYALEPGAVITLAEQVSITFEVPG